MTLQDQIDRLHAEGRLRVWSLAMTIFGDAIAPRGGAIAMSDLSEMLEALGAESGAIRTAMSRLATDGWVIRTKIGRRSYYALSESGLASVRAASPRIYAAKPPAWDGQWTIAVGPGAKEFEEDGFSRITSGVWLKATASHSTKSEDVFLVTGQGAAPPWIKAALSPEKLGERYQAVDAAWRAFDPATVKDPLEAMTARTLLIHDWRRILLRDAPVPRALRPDGWPGAAARDLVARLYWGLSPRAEIHLDGCKSIEGVSLPRPQFGGYAHRFKTR